MAQDTKICGCDSLQMSLFLASFDHDNLSFVVENVRTYGSSEKKMENVWLMLLTRADLVREGVLSPFNSRYPNA